jgi:anti-sigma B factor antagonist
VDITLRMIDLDAIVCAPERDGLTTHMVNFDVSSNGQARKLVLRGELDLSTAERLTTCVAPFAATEGDLVLDLSGLTFVDSTGIREIVRTASCLRGGSLVLVSPSPHVQRVLELTGILTVPNIVVRDEPSA